MITAHQLGVTLGTVEAVAPEEYPAAEGVSKSRFFYLPKFPCFNFWRMHAIALNFQG